MPLRPLPRRGRGGRCASPSSSAAASDAGPDCGRSQVGRVPLFLLDTNLPENPPRAPGRHRRALRRRPRACASSRRSCSASAACAPSTPLGLRARVCHMNEGHSAFLGLERHPAADGGARAQPRRGAGDRHREHRLHHPHAGAGRHRRLPARPRRAATSARLRAELGVWHAKSSSASAASIPATPAEPFNMAVAALRLAGSRQRCEPAARQVSRRDVANRVAGRARSTRCRSATSPTACTRASWISRRDARRSTTATWARAGRRSPATRACGSAVARRSPTRSCGAPTSAAASGWSPSPAGGCASSCGAGAPARPRSPRPEEVLDPEALTIGFAPPLRHLQARHAAPARPRAPGPDPQRRRAGPCRSSSPARRTRGRRRQGAHPRDRPARRAAGVPARASSSSRTTTWSCARYLVQGVRRVAQHAAPAARGERHQRHEGRVQRRPQPVDPRRLVGRGVHRETRAGRSATARSTRPRVPGPHRGRRALRPARARGRPALLRPRRRRPAARLDRPDEALRCRSSARCSTPTGWSASTSTEAYMPALQRRDRLEADGHRRAVALAAGAAGSGQLGSEFGSARSRRTCRPTSASVTPSSCGRGSSPATSRWTSWPCRSSRPRRRARGDRRARRDSDGCRETHRGRRRAVRRPGPVHGQRHAGFHRPGAAVPRGRGSPPRDPTHRLGDVILVTSNVDVGALASKGSRGPSPGPSAGPGPGPGLRASGAKAPE